MNSGLYIVCVYKYFPMKQQQIKQTIKHLTQDFCIVFYIIYIIHSHGHITFMYQRDSVNLFCSSLINWAFTATAWERVIQEGIVEWAKLLFSCIVCVCSARQAQSSNKESVPNKTLGLANRLTVYCEQTHKNNYKIWHQRIEYFVKATAKQIPDNLLYLNTYGMEWASYVTEHIWPMNFRIA